MGLDNVSLVKLAAVPPPKHELEPLILACKKYIHECGSKLNGGNMIVKRALMCGNSRYYPPFILF